MCRCHRLLALVLIPGLGGACTGAAAHAGGLPAPANHYNSYDLELHEDAGAPMFTLVDEWGESLHDAATFDRVLVPTERNDDPIEDPDLLYVRYTIGPGGEMSRMISVTNAFGEQQDWMVGESVMLLNPAEEEGGGGEVQPPLANHYKCYLVEDGPPAGAPVVLFDAFGLYATTVAEPVLWCNPAEKRVENGETYPIVDDMTWLACYATTPPTPLTPSIPIVVTDQFGSGPQTLVLRDVLCVPSMKAMPVPVTETSWSGLKAVFR